MKSYFEKIPYGITGTSGTLGTIRREKMPQMPQMPPCKKTFQAYKDGEKELYDHSFQKSMKGCFKIFTHGITDIIDTFNTKGRGKCQKCHHGLIL